MAHHVRTRLGAIALAGGFALTAAACGDDGGKASNVTNAPDTTVEVTTTTVPATTEAPATTAAPTTAAATTAPPTTAAPTATTKASTASSAATSTAASTSTKATTTTKATTPTTAATTATTVGKPTKSTILIGFPVGVSGNSQGAQKPASEVGPAWEQWVNNELGGINGHPVKVVLRDLKGDPATAVAVTKDMVDTDKVIAVVGGQDESSVSVWPKAFSDAGIPVLAIGYSPATFLQSFNGMKGVYAVSTQFPGVVGEQFIAAKAVGATKFGVVSCAEVVSCSSSEPLYVPFASKVSIGYGGLLKGALADPTYVPQCLSMQSNGVDFLQISASFVLGQRLVDDCAKQGYKPIFGASAGSVYGPDMVPLSQKGAVFAGGLNGFPWYGDSAPIKQFRDVMAKYAPGKTLEDPHITATWAAFELFRKAIANVSDNPTKDEMMNLITSVKNERLNGLLPQPLTFVKGQSGQPIDCFWPYKLANGVFSGPTTPGCWE